jgi:hypothetical protein
MTTMVWTYSAYLLVCIAVTWWVACTLRRNGTTLLANERAEQAGLADAIAHSLVVGFYLLNLGIVCLVLRTNVPAVDLQTAIELLSTKVGGVLIGLGVVHFAVLLIFAVARGGMLRARSITDVAQFDDPRLAPSRR